MRLWHEALIPLLPRQQLLGQHRECCALRGNGWGKSHSTVNYVFAYTPERLFLYHAMVMADMKKRGYSVDELWEKPCYRGKKCEPYTATEFNEFTQSDGPIYPEHNQAYLIECLDNLLAKGIEIAL